MSTFLGKYEAKADVKGRIFIPAAYRKLLPDGERDHIIMQKDPENDCLVLYPEHVWNEKVAVLNSRLNEWKSEDRLLITQFVSNAESLDIDSQGRILIPKRYLQSIAIENAEILFVGMFNKFAIWSKVRYEQTMLSSAEFANLLNEKMIQ
jgi:MraZ protein